MYKYTCVDGYLSCLLIQLKSDTLSWKPSRISVRPDVLNCVQIFISFQKANLYRKCV